MQCGFCTPGMLMSAHALLERNPHPTEEEIREALVGNLCRCTGYVRDRSRRSQARGAQDAPGGASEETEHDRADTPILWARASRDRRIRKGDRAAIFTDDMQFGPGLLYGRLVRSPHRPRPIKRIDASKALALPGVKAWSPGRIQRASGSTSRTAPSLPRPRALRGRAVAGVVATSEEIAEEAARLVEVEYEELPAVFDPLEALEPDAPLLHPDLGEL